MNLNRYLTVLRSAQLCKYTCGLYLFSCLVLLTPTSVEAQSHGVTITGTVNETVALSIAPNSIQSDIDVDVARTGSSVQMTLSGTAIKSPVIRLRLLVRSNTGFNLSGRLESKADLVTQLSVIDVRATGGLVVPQAIDNVEIPQQFDVRGRTDKDFSENESSVWDVPQPFRLLGGPRVSLGGTLESPNNALEITVLIRIKDQPTRDWRVQLTFFTTTK